MAEKSVAVACLVCKQEFPQSKNHCQEYCSVKCRDRASYLKKKENRNIKSPTGSKEHPFGEKECPTCKKKFSATRSNKRYCSHKCYRLRMSRNWTNRNREKGLCYDCSEPPIPGSNCWCEKHWLMQAAWRAGVKGKESWVKIKEILERQNYKCPYTGRNLVIGKNASIDHIKPKSLFEDQMGNIENLEWVDIEVNRAKRTLSKDEFIALCKLIASRF